MRMGMGDVASCGQNPCGFWDAFPFPGMFTSAECSAYLACIASGGSVTPTPAQAGGSPFSSGTASAADVQTLQAQCAAAGNTWDPLSSTCKPPGADYAQYIPWVVGGIALLVLAPLLMNLGRR